jgi:hypothetical protein
MGPPSPGGALGTAGLSRGGERRAAWTLWPPHCCLRAGRTLWPPHPATLDGWPPSPAGGEAYWTAACAGMTPAPACAGMTLWPPHPAVPSAPPASPARGEAYWTAACAGRTRGGGKDTVAPSPGGAFGSAGLSRQGRGVLGSRIRGNHTGGRAGACQVGRWAGWVKGFRPNPPPAQDGKHA